MTKSNAVEINSIDVSSKKISTVVEEVYQNEINKATIRFRFDVKDLVTIAAFQTVTIWENFSGTLKTDANRIFTGEVAKIERTPGEVIVTAFSDLWRAVTTSVNQTFDVNVDSEAGEGSAIFSTLATLSGLTASVQATGTSVSDIVQDKFVCIRTDVFERMQVLADIYKYQFYEDVPNQTIRFEPVGFVTNSNTIFIGGANNNVQGRVKWKEDPMNLFNKVEVIGAYSEVRTTESFNGDGAETTFALEFEPEIVEVTVDAVLQTGGVPGATTTFDYSVDKKLKKIIFESGSIPGAGASNVVIGYSYRSERPVIRSNDSSIASIKRTIKKEFTFNDIQSVDDAERRALNLLAIFSKPFLSTKLKLSPSVIESFNVKIGEVIRVVDDRLGFDEFMVIKKKKSRWPQNDVELELGDREFRVASNEYDTANRLKRLEEEQSKAGTFEVEVVDFDHTIQVKVRDFSQSSRTIQSGVLYWDSVVQGNWDEQNWGDGTEDSFVEQSIQQYLNIYDEDFNDAVYKDTTNTTATWTTTGSVTF